MLSIEAAHWIAKLARVKASLEKLYLLPKAGTSALLIW